MLTILAGSVTLAIASALVFVRAQREGPSPGTLGWYAEQAQAEGVSSWEFGSGIFEYVEPKLWYDIAQLSPTGDQILTNYTVKVE